MDDLVIVFKGLPGHVVGHGILVKLLVIQHPGDKAQFEGVKHSVGTEKSRLRRRRNYGTVDVGRSALHRPIFPSGIGRLNSATDDIQRVAEVDVAGLKRRSVGCLGAATRRVVRKALGRRQQAQTGNPEEKRQ